MVVILLLIIVLCLLSSLLYEFRCMRREIGHITDILQTNQLVALDKKLSQEETDE